MDLEIFSLVTIDNDVGEVAGAVRAAIARGQFFGRVFMPPAGQDFEFGNFMLDELADILSRIAEEQGAGEEVRDALRSALQGATTSTDLIQRAHQAAHEYRFNKGGIWGRALGVYFLENTAWPDGSPRPVQEAITCAYGIQHNQYAWTRSKYKVDPDSGRMVSRAATEEPST